MRRFWWILFLTLAAVIVLLTAGVLLYKTIPLSNTQRTRFETIIVLGYPANPDGTPSPVQRARVTEGVNEYRRGVAPVLIMTGGAAHNDRVEADVMAGFAVSLGVPASAVIREQQAHDTIQNAYYSVRIMQAHHWNTAEVVSSASHLPRASLIFQHFPIQYEMHAAPRSPQISRLYDTAAYIYEIRYADTLRLFGFRPNRYLTSDANRPVN